MSDKQVLDEIIFINEGLRSFLKVRDHENFEDGLHKLYQNGYIAWLIEEAKRLYHIENSYDVEKVKELENRVESLENKNAELVGRIADENGYF